MKKFFKGLLVLALIAGIAYPVFAAWNLRQNADGTADFVRSQGSAEYTAPIGQVFVPTYLPDVSTLSTAAIAVPITNSEVTYIQSAVHGLISGTYSTITFWHYRNGTNLGELTNGTTRMQIAVSGGATGDIDTFSPSAAGTNINRLQLNDTILIQTDGTSTYTVGSTFTFAFDPR